MSLEVAAVAAAIRAAETARARDGGGGRGDADGGGADAGGASNDAELVATEMELLLTEYSRRRGILSPRGGAGGGSGAVPRGAESRPSSAAAAEAEPIDHAAYILAGLLLLQPPLPRAALYCCFEGVCTALAPRHGIPLERARDVVSCLFCFVLCFFLPIFVCSFFFCFFAVYFQKVSASFCQWRLLLLYHDPELAHAMDALMPAAAPAPANGAATSSSWATDAMVPQGWLCSAFAGALAPTLQVRDLDYRYLHFVRILFSHHLTCAP